MSGRQCKTTLMPRERSAWDSAVGVQIRMPQPLPCLPNRRPLLSGLATRRRTFDRSDDATHDRVERVGALANPADHRDHIVLLIDVDDVAPIAGEEDGRLGRGRDVALA